MSRAANELAKAVAAYGRGEITMGDLAQEHAFYEAAKSDQATSVKDVCHRCGGELVTSGHLGGIEYRRCEVCRTDHTWNVNKPWTNPANQIADKRGEA